MIPLGCPQCVATEGDAGQVGDLGEGVLPVVVCGRELLRDVRCLVEELGVFALEDRERRWSRSSSMCTTAAAKISH